MFAFLMVSKQNTTCNELSVDLVRQPSVRVTLDGKHCRQLIKTNLREILLTSSSSSNNMPMNSAFPTPIIFHYIVARSRCTWQWRRSVSGIFVVPTTLF